MHPRLFAKETGVFVVPRCFLTGFHPFWCAAGCALLIAISCCGSPAPAPLLLSPMDGTNNVDPDPTLSWNWVDELVDNGSFETGMNPGWYTGGPNPEVWQIFVSSTNAYGMGYQWVTASMPTAFRPTAQLIHDLYIPSDATVATLRWEQRIWNLVPSTLIGRLRVLLYENGGALVLLDNATGSENIYRSHNWVARSTNLLAYAGRSLQLVFEADGYSPPAANLWYADVDGISFSCQHSVYPQFQVLVGKSAILKQTNLVGEVADLSFSSVVLDPLATYYWKVGAVRDGVTNFSPISQFQTGQRFLP